MPTRTFGVGVTEGEYALLQRCQSLASALGVPSTQRAIIARALRSTLVGLTREAKRAGIDVDSAFANIKPRNARKTRYKRVFPTASPPPTGPRVRID